MLVSEDNPFCSSDMQYAISREGREGRRLTQHERRHYREKNLPFGCNIGNINSHLPLSKLNLSLFVLIDLVMSKSYWFAVNE